MAEKQHALPEGREVRFLTYATFLSRNKWRLAAGACLAVGLLLVIGLVQTLRKRKETKAFEAHLKAETAQEYRSVGEDFPGTFYGSVSLIEAGNSLFEEEKFAEARKLYRKYLSAYPKSRFRPWVHNLLGATFEAEKKYDEAIQRYRRAEASPWLKQQAKLNIGRCYEFKGDSESEKAPDIALEHYERAQTYYGQLRQTGSSSPESIRAIGPWQREAESRMSFLREKEKKARERQSEKKVDKGNAS